MDGRRNRHCEQNDFFLQANSADGAEWETFSAWLADGIGLQRHAVLVERQPTSGSLRILAFATVWPKHAATVFGRHVRGCNLFRDHYEWQAARANRKTEWCLPHASRNPASTAGRL